MVNTKDMMHLDTYNVRSLYMGALSLEGENENQTTDTKDMMYLDTYNIRSL